MNNVEITLIIILIMILKDFSFSNCKENFNNNWFKRISYEPTNLTVNHPNYRKALVACNKLNPNFKLEKSDNCYLGYQYKNMKLKTLNGCKIKGTNICCSNMNC